MATLNGTLVKDAHCFSNTPTSNDGTSTTLQVGSQPSGGSLKSRLFLHFTMPSEPVGGGTISDVTINLTQWLGAVTKDYGIYVLTQTAWVENQVTWNQYSTGNNWTTAGGDFSTLLDTISLTSTGGLKTWSLGSSYTWGDEVHLLLKEISENNGTDSYKLFRSKQYATAGERPYLEVTYTEGGGYRFNPQFGRAVFARF